MWVGRVVTAGSPFPVYGAVPVVCVRWCRPGRCVSDKSCGAVARRNKVVLGCTNFGLRETLYFELGAAVAERVGYLFSSRPISQPRRFCRRVDVAERGSQVRCHFRRGLSFR